MTTRTITAYEHTCQRCGFANLERKRELLADALKREGFKFDKFRIERVPAGDFSAGA